jgi:hypothetical protein
MPAATFFNFKPTSAQRRQEVAQGPKFQPRDVVAWTNPNTGDVWADLLVEFAYPRQGVCLVRGCFGRMSARSGDLLVESRTVRIDQLQLEARAGERV